MYRTRELVENSIVNIAIYLRDFLHRFGYKRGYDKEGVPFGDIAGFFKCVPAHLRTQELYKFAVKLHGMLLKAVPEAEKTKELCLLAMQRSPLAIRFTPPRFISREFCLAWVKRFPLSLAYIPEAFKTEEICKVALDGNKRAFFYPKVPVMLMYNLFLLAFFYPKLGGFPAEDGQ